MKHILAILFSLLLTFQASAQVKGHEYFCWAGTLGNDINCEVRMEHDNDQLALGEIIYFRKNGKTSSIPLYGTIKPTSKGFDVTLFEYLPDGRNTGVLNMTIHNTDIPYAVWNSPDNTTRFNFNIKETKAFPYGEVETYFHPLKEDEDADGIYISSNRFPETTAAFNRLELNRLYMNDISYAINFVNTGNDFSRFMVASQTSPNRLNVIKRGSINTNIEIRLFRNFVFVYIIYDPDNGFRQAGEISNFYMRTTGEKIINWSNWPSNEDEGFQKLTAARLVDDEISIYNNPDAVIGMEFLQQDDIMVHKGWTKLSQVKPGVKDIFIGDIADGIYPVLAILNQDGTVQILTLVHSAPKGQTYVSEPLHGLKDIERFAFSNPDEIEDITFWAINKEGKYFPVYGCPIFGDWEMKKTTSEGVVRSSISITPEWRIQYNKEVRTETNDSYIENFYGSFWKTDQDYKTYEYRFNEQNNSREGFKNKDCDIKGSFKAVMKHENWGNWIEVTPLKGLQFDIPEGQSGNFYYFHTVG